MNHITKPKAIKKTENKETLRITQEICNKPLKSKNIAVESQGFVSAESKSRSRAKSCQGPVHLVVGTNGRPLNIHVQLLVSFSYWQPGWVRIWKSWKQNSIFRGYRKCNQAATPHKFYIAYSMWKTLNTRFERIQHPDNNHRAVAYWTHPSGQRRSHFFRWGKFPPRFYNIITSAK